MGTQKYWKKSISIGFVFLIVVFISGNIANARSYPFFQATKEDSIKQSIQSLRESITSDPENPVLHRQLGYLYLEIEGWDAATDAFKISLDLDDTSAESYNGLGLAHHGKGKSPILPFEALKALFKIDNYSKAEKEFKRAMDRDPEYLDPVYNVGVTYLAKGGMDNYQRAVDSFTKVMEKDIVFKDADLMLGIAFRHLEDFINAELVLKKVIEDGRTVGKAMVHLSEIYLETDRNEQATEMYYSGIVKLRDPKTWEDVYEELEILLRPEDRDRIIQLPYGEKGELVRRFWKQRDPTPTTMLNERLVEHFKRVKYARINFPDGIPPYFDDRGKIYVKYGAPDAKYLSQMTGENVKENESWSYEQSIQKGLTFDFVKRGTAYRLAQDLSEAAPTGARMEERNQVAIQLYQQRADFTDSYNMFALESNQIDHSVMSNFRSERLNAVEKAPVSITRYEQAEPFLPFIYNIAQFRVARDKSRVEVYMGVSNNQLRYVPSGEGMISTLLCSFLIQDSAFADIKREDRQFALQAKSIDEVQNKLFMHQEDFELTPGNYAMALRIENPQSNALGSYRNDIEVRDFRGTSLMVSDIQLSTNVQTTRETDGKFTKKGFRIVPYPYTVVRRENPISIYFEVYNLKYNASGKTDYTVTHSVEMLEYKRSILSKTFGAIGRLFGTKKKAGISTSYQQVKTETEVPEYLALDMGKLPPGLSRLVISITDNTSGETASVSKELQLLE